MTHYMVERKLWDEMKEKKQAPLKGWKIYSLLILSKEVQSTPFPPASASQVLLPPQADRSFVFS